MLEIKTGLQGVNVSLWSATMMEMAKVAIIAAGIGLAGFGAYHFYQQNQEESGTVIQSVSSLKQDNKTEDKSQAASAGADLSIAAPQNTNAEPVEPKAPEVLPRSSYQKSESLRPAPTSTQVKESSGLVEQEMKEPEFKNSQPTTPSDISLPEDGISHKTLPESMQPEVVIKRDNRDKFHYQFVEGKLVLYADFNEKLYEVLELNQYGQRQLYLVYDGRFFFLNSSANGISPLTEVKDKNLVQILQAYQKRK